MRFVTASTVASLLAAFVSAETVRITVSAPLDSLVWIQTNEFQPFDAGIGVLPGQPWAVNFNVSYPGHNRCWGSSLITDWDTTFATLVDPKQDQSFAMIGSASGAAGTYFQIFVKALRGEGFETIELGQTYRRDRKVDWASEWYWDDVSY